MSKKEYEELPVTHLSDEQLTDLLRYSESFTEDSLASIQARFSEKTSDEQLPKPIRKKKHTKLLLLAASLLLVVGFAQRDAVKAFYYQVFGDTVGELGEQSTYLTSVTEDQGIELKALATFEAGETTYFLMQLTDLTGDRLDETMNWLEWQELGLGASHLVTFEESTNTATFLTRADSTELEAANHELTLLSFQSQLQVYDVVSEIQLADFVEKETTWVEFSETVPFWPREQLDTGTSQVWEERVGATLTLDEVDIPLVETGGGRLSNVGYKNGLLHLQVKWLNKRQDGLLHLDLQNVATGATLQPLVSLQVDRRTLNMETGRTDYQEFVFEVPEEQLGQYRIHVSGERYAVHQEGEWALNVAAVEPIEAREYQDIALPMEGDAFQLTDIDLSPISISFTVKGLSSGGKPLGEVVEDNLSVLVTLADGTRHEFNQALRIETPGDEPNRVQVEGPYVDLGKVVDITINGQALIEK